MIFMPLVAVGMFVVHNAAWTQSIKQKTAALMAQDKLKRLAVDTRETSGERVMISAVQVQQLIRDALGHYGDAQHADTALGAAKDVFDAVKDGGSQAMRSARAC